MKTTIMAIAAAMMMSATAMAQDNQAQGQRPRRMDRTEMIKARTDYMVKEYGLNEQQAQKLQTLNTEYAEKLPMMRRQRQQGQAGQRQEGQAGQGQRPQRQPGDSLRRGQRGQGQRTQVNPEETRKNMDAYNAELEKIMTAEQYAKYKENAARRMNGQRNGNRPQRNDQ